MDREQQDPAAVGDSLYRLWFAPSPWLYKPKTNSKAGPGVSVRKWLITTQDNCHKAAAQLEDLLPQVPQEL